MHDIYLFVHVRMYVCKLYNMIILPGKDVT